MIQLIKKKLFPETMEILYGEPFTEETIARDFEIKAAGWTIRDGWLTGTNRENAPGMMISKQDFYGDIMLEFDARTVLPCTHDINVMWHGSWNEQDNTRAEAYVAGLQGWWDGKIGFEKSPDNSFTVCTQLFEFVPGKTYHLQVGNIEGHLFIAVDGRLALEVTDPHPIDIYRHGRIGFEAYCSQIQFRDFCVKKVCWQDDKKEYTPEF